MKITNTFQFEQDVDAIFDAYTNEDFIRTKMESFGARDIVININKDDDTTTVEVTRKVQIELPSVFKKFAKPWNQVSQKEVWQGKKGGPYYGDMEINIEGAPATVKGQMKIAATPNGCAAANITEVKSSLPFLGKKLSQIIAETSEKIIAEEFEYVQKNA